MPDRVTIHIPSFPRCPDCGAEAHELTFRPVVRQVDGQTDEGPTVYDDRELIDFAWRCPNEHPVVIDIMPSFEERLSITYCPQ